MIGSPVDWIEWKRVWSYTAEISQTDMKKEKKKKTKNTEEIWDNFKMWNLCTIGIWGDERMEQKKIFEVILAESFSKLMTANHRSRSPRIPSMINTKITATMYIIFKQLKNKQTNRENCKRCQRGLGETLYKWRNNDKNYSSLFVRNHDKKESRVKCLNYWKKKTKNKKSPT